jgi:hypothetical protein
MIELILDDTMKEPVMNSKETSQTDQQASVEQPIKRRPYDRPVLVNLGSLREMTTKLTAAGGADGGKKQFTGRGGLYGLGSRFRG